MGQNKIIRFSGKKWLKVSYFLMIGSFILLFYSVFTAPYATKIPYIGRYFRAGQMFWQVQHYTLGSLERQRLEAMAGAVWQGKNFYTFTPSPQTINMLQNQGK